MIYEKPRLCTAGDHALLVEFGDSIDPEINSRVRNLKQVIEINEISGVVETVPAYCSLLVYFNPLLISFSKLKSILQKLSTRQVEIYVYQPKLIEIPVVYGNEFGPDLEYVAGYNNLSTQEVVQIHTGTNYLIYMLGFIPGFPYLGGMSVRIATPRLETPRLCIPAGSVGIAETQTGIYPAESPGGWRIIGRTPLRLFDTQSDQPSSLHAGDYIAFVSVSSAEFTNIHEAVERGTYKVKEKPWL